MLEMVSFSNQIINVLVKDNRKGWCLFIAIYACPIGVSFKEISGINKFPWLAARDFNEVSIARDKSGGAVFSQSSSAGCNDHVHDCYLMDLGDIGSKFTWSNCRSRGHLIRERFEKALCYAKWRECFPQAMVHNLPKSRSDHHPILIFIDNEDKANKKLKPFHF